MVCYTCFFTNCRQSWNVCSLPRNFILCSVMYAYSPKVSVITCQIDWKSTWNKQSTSAPNIMCVSVFSQLQQELPSFILFVFFVFSKEFLRTQSNTRIAYIHGCILELSLDHFLLSLTHIHSPYSQPSKSRQPQPRHWQVRSSIIHSLLFHPSSSSFTLHFHFPISLHFEAIKSQNLMFYSSWARSRAKEVA